MRNKLISFCLVFLLLAAFPLTAAAEKYDPSRTGSISVSLVSKSGDTPLVGAEFSVFHVATIAIDTYGDLIYNYTEPFESCGVALNDPKMAEALGVFVSGKDIPSQKIVTDALGKAICEDLPLGLYFVKQTGTVEGFAPCASFLVTLPMKTDSGLQYDVDASPKTEVAKLVSITIKKIWNTDKTTTILQRVTVQLLRHEELVQTATLREENGWQVTYTGLPESDGYSVKEVNVPKGFTATYGQNGYTFTVTNTASLAQTGQLIWPIPLLAVAGLFFLLAGVAILRKTEKHNA